MLERRSLLAAVLNCTSDTSYSIASQVASHRISGPSLSGSRARAHTPVADPRLRVFTRFAVASYTLGL